MTEPTAQTPDSAPNAAADAPRGSDPCVWPHSAHFWRLYGSPLRPHATDLAHYRREIDAVRAGFEKPRTLILGVTPELYEEVADRSADVLAVDASPEMIAHVWPGPPERARRGDWRALGIPDASRELVLCDGGLMLLDHPSGQRALVRELARVLVPGGVFLLRLYLPATTPENPAEILADLRAGKFGSSNAFRFKLCAAMQRSPEEGVALADVWRAVHAAAPDPDELSRLTGWPREHQKMIDVFRDNPARFHYVALPRFRELFERDPGDFELLRLHYGAYELSERCPIAVLRRR